VTYRRQAPPTFFSKLFELMRPSLCVFYITFLNNKNMYVFNFVREFKGHTCSGNNRNCYTLDSL
jgi:hypothetical protein